MKTRAMLLVALVLAAVSAPAGAAGQQARDEASVPRISLADFKKAFDAKAVVILDVRDAASYAAGHIPGAILVPLEALAEEGAGAQGGEEADRRLLCLTGRAHQRPCGARPRRLGVKNVKALLGGIQGWQAADYPMAKGAATRAAR